MREDGSLVGSKESISIFLNYHERYRMCTEMRRENLFLHLCKMRFDNEDEDEEECIKKAGREFDKSTHEKWQIKYSISNSKWHDWVTYQLHDPVLSRSQHSKRIDFSWSYDDVSYIWNSCGFYSSLRYFSYEHRWWSRQISHEFLKLRTSNSW